MEKYIYKIENLLNHKKYIGQTNDPKRRFKEHKNMSENGSNVKILYLAIKKYGIENFSFEIIEKTPYYNEREKYWISHYDSFRNGYNMTEGGENPPVLAKENHPMCKHTQEDIDKIIFLLKNTKTSVKDIAKIMNYNVSSINRINIGELWKDDNLEYPIRKLQSKQGLIERANQIKNDLINTNLTQKEIAKKYGVGRTTITAINNGQNYKDNNLSYPLRK